MADPLSIAASIAGVVTLADLVFARLYKYTKAAKDAPNNVKDLASQVNSLGGLLNSLARLARALDGQAFDVTLRMEHIDACNFVLSKLDKKLQRAEKDLKRHGHFDKFERRLKWPFSSSEVKEIKAELSEHEAKIGLALSADTMSGLLLSLSYQNGIRDTTAEILGHAQETRRITARIERNSERTKILDFFLKHNPQENYDMSLGLRHPRTGLWLLRLPAFQNWLDSSSSKLWLSGIPGAGKTVLAASIIEAALRKSSEKVGVAFYFCDYKTEDTWKPGSILSAILAQLALQREDAFQELDSFYQRLHPSNGLARSPGNTELTMVLSKVTETFEKVFVIVDGLDECGKHTTAVVEDLASYAEDHDNLCTALLSRDEDEIRFRLGEDFDNLEIAAHSEDVAEYVSSEIQERQRTGRLRVSDTELLADIQQQLVDKAHGMFRWVTCQLDHLGDCHNDRACREALDKLPPDLEGTYVRLLQRVRPSQESLVQMTLHFVGYMGSRMSVPVLQQAVSVSLEQKSLSLQDVVYEESISRACSSLIRKTKDGRRFEFAHFSVREFLESTRLPGIGLGQFQISRPRCFRMLAVQCLRFLHLENFDLDITPQGDSVEEMESGLATMLSSWTAQYPFYAFASMRWFGYARSCRSDEEVWRLSRKLFDRRKSNSFTQWALHLLQGTYERYVSDRPLPVARPGSMLGVLNPSFTPLHLSAILGLPEICQYLMAGGIDVVSECHFGSAIDCAVSGLGALWPAVGDDFGDGLSDMMRDMHSGDFRHQHMQHDVSRTVECVLGTQVPLNLRRTVVRKPGLFKAAIMTSSAIRDFSMVAVLIRNGIEPRDEDRDVFRGAIGQLCSIIEASYHSFADLGGQNIPKDAPERRLESFIRSMNDMLDTFTGAYALCSIAWNEALSYDISFTSDISTVSSQISLDLESLRELGISGAATCDMAKLDIFMGDPRITVDGPDCRIANGSTILHVALGPGLTNFARFPDRLAVVQRLLDAGWKPSAINGYGDTPLHNWTWAENANEAEKLEVEKLIRSFLEKGASIHTKGMNGRTALHYWALRGLTGTLQAMLHVISNEEAAVALAATDDDGFTPLMRALQENHADTAEVLIQYGKNEFGSLDISKLLSLVGGIQSASLLRVLVAIGVPIKSDSGESALHHVKSKTPVGCIRLLKEHLPDSCGQRAGGRLPIEIYLREWSLGLNGEIEREQREEAMNPSFESLQELAAIKSHEPCDEYGLSVWEYATTHLMKNVRLRLPSRPQAPNSKRRERAVTEVVRHLMKLGYMKSHEISTGNSGFIPILCCLTSENRDSAGLWPAEPQLLIEISTETTHWSEFRTSTIAFDLLYASFDMGNEPLLRTLLEKGIPLVRNGVALSTAHRICETLYEASPEKYMECARVVLEYCPSEVFGATESVRDRLALIHRVCSPWLAEELLRRGADPNSRTPLRNGSAPALVYHLSKRSPAVALHLLRRGGDPELADANGMNAIHAALAHGHMDVLQAIHEVLNLPGHNSWYATCDFLRGRTLWRCLNGLEISALNGRIDSMRFLLDNGDVQRFKNSPRARYLVYLATRGGHGDAIRYLHQKGFGINIVGPPHGNTPLHAAVLGGTLPIVEVLVQLGAVLMEDRQGLNPLELAYTSNKPKMAEFLDQAFPEYSRRAGPQSQSVGRGRQLSAAFEESLTREDIHACKNLHRLGYPLDHILSCGCPYLNKALKLKDSSVAIWLANEGASLTRRSCLGHGNSPALSIWLRRAQPDRSLTDLLLEKYLQQGGDIFEPGLLVSAAQSPDSERIKALLRAMEASIDNWKPRTKDSHAKASSVVSQLGGIDVLSDAHKEASRHHCVTTANALADYIAEALPHDEPCPPSAIVPLFTGDWKHRMADAKFSLTPMWESRDDAGNTAMLVACERLPLDVITFLKSQGADCTETNLWYRSTLHYVASNSRPEVFSMLVRSGVSPHRLNDEAVSPVHLAMAYGGLTAFILSHEIALNDTQPMPWAPLRTDCGEFLRRDFKLYLRRLGKRELRRITNLYPEETWNPLCRFALTEDVEVLENLLELDADINHEGSPKGSALMLVCASGIVASAKFLVRRGASLCYQTPDGQYRSALAAAKASASITHWLLVGRFTEQPKIGPQAPAGQAEETTRCWSGGAKAEYLITEWKERYSDESSLEYYTRLMEIKEEMRGQVVPPAGNRKTARPSRLIPVETVRRHPEDKRAPQE